MISLKLEMGDVITTITRLAGVFTVEYRIATELNNSQLKRADIWMSELNYAVLSHNDTRSQSDAFMSDFRKKLSEDPKLLKKLWESIEKMNPGYKSPSSYPESEPKPEPYFDGCKHFDGDRVEWPTVNTGASLEGYVILGLLVDQLSNAGKNAELIQRVPEIFEIEKSFLFEAWIRRSNAIENISSLANVVKDNSTDGRVNFFNAKISGWKKVSKKILVPQNSGKWLMLDMFQDVWAISLKKIEQGILEVYFSNTSREGLQKTRRIVVDSK